ncbi:MAG: TlpA family protein disulfide reductase [Prevotella sp.]|nr:TlpA family protein disulfide reductase [Prevotella sp.]
MFTDFTVQGDDGKTYKLSDYVGKGQVTLVDFWASWCGPCRRAIPDIKSLYEKYNGKGMSFLGVAVWDEPADTRGAIEELQIPWPVIVGNQKLEEPTNLYGIMGIPHIIVFGPDGTILSRGLTGDDLANKLAEVTK